MFWLGGVDESRIIPPVFFTTLFVAIGGINCFSGEGSVCVEENTIILVIFVFYGAAIFGCARYLLDRSSPTHYSISAGLEGRLREDRRERLDDELRTANESLDLLRRAPRRFDRTVATLAGRISGVADGLRYVDGATAVTSDRLGMGLVDACVSRLCADRSEHKRPVLEESAASSVPRRRKTRGSHADRSPRHR